MILSNLIKDITTQQIIGNCDCDIKGINCDSREIKKDFLFIAICGTIADGHNYINTAIANGAKAIVCQSLPTQINDDIIYIQTKDSAKALGFIASAFYNKPSKNIIIVGVTGTNGKTTIATLLYRTFKLLGYKVGLLSTICNYINDKQIASTHTTPDTIQLQKLLSEMVNEGCEYAFMEVSSHSVDQHRITGIDFNGGIFTNLTRDHLDYHKTFDCYLNAKKKFFDNLSKNAFALTNLDDKNGKIMLQNTVAEQYSYSTMTLADYKASIIEESLDGMLLNINNKEVYTQFVGKFNAANLLAVFGATQLLKIDADKALIAISSLKTVAGRFDTIRSKNNITAIVDYAHTPDAVINTLTAIKEICKNGKITTVIGCGGNRDKGKRPLMAKAAVNYSNNVIFTADNPRNEKIEDIIKDMTDGLDKIQMQKVLCISDREQAIKTACKLADTGDIVLVAGKGHEDYQEINGIKNHFNDKEIINQIFNV